MLFTRHLVPSLIAGSLLFPVLGYSRPPLGSGLTLAGAHVSGPSGFSAEDLLRGLELKVGAATTTKELQQACDHLKELKAFHSERCSSEVDGMSLWLNVSIDEKAVGAPLIFDNFVWTSREALLARIHSEVPLFTPEIPDDSALNAQIVRVLDRVVAERGIKASVFHNDFWARRGMNVFSVRGIAAPAVSCQIEGRNPPITAKMANWCKTENFSMAKLNWDLGFAVRNLYLVRGYLRPVVSEPVIQFLGEKDGSFPVQVLVHIESGPQYAFDSVRFAGLAKARSALLASKWKLKRGDIYDASYENDFAIKEILDEQSARHDSTSSDEVSTCDVIDDVGNKVSVTVTVRAPRKIIKVDEHNSRVCGDFEPIFFFVGKFIGPG